MRSLPKLAANPLPSLADEILAALPKVLRSRPEGANVGILAAHLGADGPNIRRAMVRLSQEGRADLRRRNAVGREWIVVPWRYRAPDADGERHCPTCGDFFRLKPRTRYGKATSYDNRHCCSRTCSVSWSWTRPGVAERRKASIRKERATPKAKARLAAHNRRRWSDPAQHRRLSAWNRKRWSDPVIRAELSRAIALVQRTPEMRKLYSDLRKEWWKNPKMRRKMIAAMKKSKSTPEARARFSELLRARWRDPVTRKKLLAAVRRNQRASSKKAKGRKQSAVHVAKRVVSFKKTKAARKITAKAA